MSILNNSVNQDIPSAEKTSKQIISQAKSTYNQLVSVFNNGSKMFWRNPNATPSEIASALGSDAAEIFNLHSKIGNLLLEINPNAIQEGLSVVGNFTINDNGTVTILEQ